MTTPKFLDDDVYNVKDRENQKRPNEIFVGFDKYGKYSVRVGNISNIAYPVRYTRSELYQAAQERIKQLEQLDSEASTHVESQIAMFERFTGEPPYVGWRGLGLALKEELEAKDERVKELEAALNEAANDIETYLDSVGYNKKYHINKYRAIAGGKDETK